MKKRAPKAGKYDKNNRNLKAAARAVTNDKKGRRGCGCRGRKR